MRHSPPTAWCCARAEEMVLVLAEVRQHVVPAPAGKPKLAPMVVVGGLAAHVDHGVDRGRAADHLAARIVQAAAVEALLGLGLEHPVRARIADGEQVADRDVEPDPVVAAAGFQQQHALARVGGQPVRQHAAGRARADDDVVVVALDRRCCEAMRFPSPVPDSWARHGQSCGRVRAYGNVPSDMAQSALTMRARLHRMRLRPAARRKRALAPERRFRVGRFPHNSIMAARTPRDRRASPTERACSLVSRIYWQGAPRCSHDTAFAPALLVPAFAGRTGRAASLLTRCVLVLAMAAAAAAYARWRRRRPSRFSPPPR